MEASLGGLRRHVVDLLKGLHALGVPQGLAFSPVRADKGCWEAVHWAKLNKIDVHEVPMHRRIAPFADLRAAHTIRRLVRFSGANILHLHSSKAGGIGRLAVALLPGVRVVYTPNGAPVNIAAVYGLIERVLGRLRTDCLIAVSPSEYSEFSRAGYVSASRLHCVESGIDLAEVERLAMIPPTVPASSGPIVVAVGRLSAQKDPIFLAHVSSMVLRRYPGVQFIWAGDGEMRRDFESAIVDLGISDRWLITGWVDNPFPYLRIADVMALASRYESFGYVTLEAMTLGKPVVGTDVAGTRDLIDHGDTGLLTPLDDVAAFAQSLGVLIGSPELRSTMGGRARAKSASYGLERMADQTLDVYMKALA